VTQGTCSINGQEFTTLPDVRYKSDYVAICQHIDKVRKEEGEEVAERTARTLFRGLFLSDLFFIVYFVFKNPVANEPFVVDACREVEDGPKDMTEDVWAREHFKSTIITKAETLQYHANPEAWHPKVKDGSTCFLSATAKLAKKILAQMTEVMKTEAQFLNFMFPHVPDQGYWGPFWEDPEAQSPMWNIDRGIKLRRHASSHTPCMFSAGLEDGMPVGDHYGRLIFDDITNMNVAKSPQRMQDIKELFDVAQDVGMIGGHSRVVGTFYHWNDPLVYVRDKKKINSDEPLYTLRIKPATHDGSPNGMPVLLPQETLDIKKTQSTYYSQQLCNPVPTETRKLSGSMLKEVSPENIPANVVKVMAVDPAGEREDGKGDNWAMAVVAIEPNTDELGASNFYITDLFIDRLDEKDAPYTCAQMYLRNGMIQMLGVEKVGQSTAEVHIANALKIHGRHLSKEAKNLMPLKPAKREKTGRIEKGWSYLLANGKIHISTKIAYAYRNKLSIELDDFPYAANDDGSDILAYVFKDMMQDFEVRALLSSFEPQKHIDLYGDRKRPLNSIGGRSWASR
jgi:hypothetical protein